MAAVAVEMVNGDQLELREMEEEDDECIQGMEERQSDSEPHIEDIQGMSPHRQSNTLLCLKRHAQTLFCTSIITMVSWLCILLVLTIAKRRLNEEWFWISFAIKNVVIISLEYVLGHGVLKWGWHVGYTRKTVHVAFFLLPFLLDLYLPLPKEDEWLWAMWNVHLICWMLLMITKPFRKLFPIIRTFYAAVDRPEDKGLTQVYTIAQVPISIVIIAGFAVLFHHLDRDDWTLCPIIAVTFGDGLAEPVAVFWEKHKLCGGTHKFRSHGLCSGEKTFTRSVEGSMTVFLWTVVSVALLSDNMGTSALLFSLLVLPLTMTLLETVAPHSLDNPFLLLWGYLVLVLAHFIEEYE